MTICIAASLFTRIRELFVKDLKTKIIIIII